MNIKLVCDLEKDIIPTYPVIKTGSLATTLLAEDFVGHIDISALIRLECGEDADQDTLKETENDIFSGLTAIAIIPTDTTSGQALAWWYGCGPVFTKDTDFAGQTAIRSALYGEYAGRPVVFALHGDGYDWIDYDILGGNGDGKARRDFEKRITCTFDVSGLQQ